MAVDDMQSLNYRTATHQAGDSVSMHVAAGKAARDVTVTVALPPENPPREVQTIAGRNPLTGAKVENLSPAAATELQMDVMAKGVAIVAVSPNGYRRQLGLPARRHRAQRQWRRDQPRRRSGAGAERRQPLGHGGGARRAQAASLSVQRMIVTFVMIASCG